MRWYFADGDDDARRYAADVLRRLHPDGAIVPSIWMLEVANVLVRAERKQLTTEALSQVFLSTLRRLPIEIVEHSNFDRIIELARRYALSVYDAAYLDLALEQGLPIATLDVDLLEASRRAGVPRF